jgi:hypothetical protein
MGLQGVDRSDLRRAQAFDLAGGVLDTVIERAAPGIPRR